MATADNRFEQGLTKEQWLTAFGTLVQFKVDKPGGVLPADASNTRAIAEWFNTVDDLMLASFNGGGGQQFEYIDNTASRDAFPSVAVQTDEDIEIDITTDRNMLELTWFSVTAPSQASFGDMRINISQNSQFNNIVAEFNLTQRPGGGAFDFESGFKGNTLIMGPFASAPFSPSPGVLRFFVRLTNSGQVGPSPVYEFAYVVKAFDLTLTDFTPEPA